MDVDQQVKAEQELSEKLAQISQAKKHQDILVSHAVSREERMVALKTEVNDLREQLDMSQRYKAPGEIEAWRREMAEDGIDAFRGNGRLRPAEEELARLRRENAELRMEREILKKAAAYFAKHQR